MYFDVSEFVEDPMKTSITDRTSMVPYGESALEYYEFEQRFAVSYENIISDAFGYSNKTYYGISRVRRDFISYELF